ncbi:MAG: sigma-70 family RNA polymerase sigma factor [Phycisphaerae bacterium]|nr:sigma-70 family RNA polymerase sigma factor [Phycisphaerae bacterium]
MQSLQAPALAELAVQLTRGPRRLRLRQLLNIEFLLSVIDPGKAYPADFICHCLTGYRRVPPDGTADERLIEADVLIADLVALAERLSEDANIVAEDWPTAVYSIAELAERFDVSTKTIFRWRRRGLVGWKFRYADRRMRVVFPDACVRRFVAQHAEIVSRGSSFSQLTRAERDSIVERARALAGQGQSTVNSVARALAAETGRAVETIRLILKAHDESHPGAGIFNRSRLDVSADDQRLRIWEAHQDGVSVAVLAERFNQPPSAIYRTITQMRARDMKSRKIEYIASPAFEEPGIDELIANDPDVQAPYRPDTGGPRRIPADLPPYLQQLFRIPLLTSAGEAALFRKMNYLKFRADRLRQQLDPDEATASDLDAIDALLDEANAIKNQITQANLRLVVSIAKRHLGPALDFFEIISDGNVSLMRAVDKFDYTRGFKFSTYASWAIIRNYARLIPEQRCHRDRYQTGREELLEITAERGADEQDDEQNALVRGVVERMLASLDLRERRILRQRFGLDEQQTPQTLEQIGRHFGVSKERIRQLETRAIRRLRTDFALDVQRLLGS